MQKAKRVNRNSSQEKVAEVGQTTIEAIENHPRQKVQEKYGDVLEAVDTAKEALGDETQLYGTAVAGFIEAAYQPKLLGRDLINEVTLDMSGYDSLKIPKHNLLTASQINADGTFSGGEETTGYGEETIEVNWYGTYTDIPLNLARKSAVDLIADRLEQIGRAISRKVDSDVVGEMEKAGTKNDSHYDPSGEAPTGNYLYGGETGGSVNSDDGFDSNKEITFDVVINAIGDHRDFDAQPDTILTNNKTWVRMHTDQDMKDALAFGTTTSGDVATVQQFGTLSLMVSTQVTDDKTILVDSDNCGYFIDASPVETWDGRVSNTVQMEVVGAKAYGVRIVRQESVFVIHEGVDEPATN